MQTSISLGTPSKKEGSALRASVLQGLDTSYGVQPLKRPTAGDVAEPLKVLSWKEYLSSEKN